MKKRILFWPVLLIVSVFLTGCATNPPLNSAVVRGDAGEVQRLLNSGEKINAIAPIAGFGGGRGLTPLGEAVLRDASPETVKILLDHGADINIRLPNYWNETVLHFAAEKPARTEILKLFLNHKADINIQNERGWTPLSLAALHGCTESVQMLLERGADINLKCRYYNLSSCADEDLSVVEVAQKKGHSEIVKLINNARKERAAQAAEDAKAQISEKLQNATLAQLLEQTDSSNEAFIVVLTDKLIEAKNRELPALIMQSTVDRRIALLTLIEKRLVQAQAQIARCNSDAESYVRLGRESDAVASRSLAVAVQAYVSVMKEYQVMLMQS